MKVKKYVGKTIQDTIFKVKADLGSDAIILDTRKYKTGGFLGLFKKEQVEVIAALEEDKKVPDNKETLEQQIDDLKKMITDLKEGTEKSFSQDITRSFVPVFNYLLKQGVNKRYCKEIITDIKNEEDYLISQNVLPKIRGYLLDIIGESAPIKVDCPGQVITFIGPTGVGKTTTIAKIAAKFALNNDKKVGLVTADTYRVAAVQQIETYSKLVDLPLKVIYDSQRFNQVINDNFKNYDLVLIDTPGSSWRDQIQLGRLKAFTLNNIIDEVHLIISLSTKTEDLNSIVDNFSRLNPDKLLLTKLDETSTYGNIINLRKKYGMPFSYITFGQNVPEDIKIAKAENLLDYIMGDFYG